MASQIQLRRGTASQWSSVNPVLAQGEMGVETDTGQFKIGDGSTAWGSLSYGGLQGPAGTAISRYYGDGSDGDLTLSSGVTTLTRDFYYNNLTLEGTAIINTAGYRIFVANTLNLTNAGPTAIRSIGNTGGNASNATGGAAGTAVANAVVAGCIVGIAGTTATAAAGTTPSSASAGNNGGSSGAGGAGGTGTLAGGAARAGTVTSITTRMPFKTWQENFQRGVVLALGGSGAPGGSAGGGDGTNAAAGGGGGGAGGGFVVIYAKNITRAATTNATAICACGGNGGNGATRAAGNVGGGGGGGGAGGGYVWLAYETLSGTATPFIDVSGGNGGNGGNGVGTGLGGNGGTGGSAGVVAIIKSDTQAYTEYLSAEAPLVPPVPNSATGGTGTPGVVFQVTL